MTHNENDPDTFEHLVEPRFDLERGEELNRKAGDHDPAFAKKMKEGREKAARVKRGE
jgi:hypothetical protein